MDWSMLGNKLKIAFGQEKELRNIKETFAEDRYK